ncbi:hypothetical protein [Cardiobacterium valvarum]|nr:hypothetical protein [Cardiobacterium valvarum]
MPFHPFFLYMLCQSALCAAIVCIGQWLFAFPLRQDAVLNIVQHSPVFLALAALVFYAVHQVDVLLRRYLDGARLPVREQRWAFALVAVLLLFETFVLGAWLQDGVLVWRPAWLGGVIDGLRAHSGALHDAAIAPGWFNIEIRDTVFAAQFADAAAFLVAPVADGVLLFLGLQLCFFPLMVLAAYPLLSRLLDEAGFAAVAPRTLWAHGRRLRVVIYSLFAALCLLMTPLLLVFCPMGLFAEAAVDAAAWREAALCTVLYLPPFVFALRYLGGWRDVLRRTPPAAAL